MRVELELERVRDVNFIKTTLTVKKHSPWGGRNTSTHGEKEKVRESDIHRSIVYLIITILT